MAAMQQVLTKVDIRCITLAASPDSHSHSDLLVRVEGLEGSLEITVCDASVHSQLGILLHPKEVLLSHSPCIENVMELHIIGRSFYDDQELHHTSAAVPSLGSVSFNCE